MKTTLRRKLGSAILYLALFWIALLAFPVCVLLVPISLIWTLADAAIRRLEP